MSPISFAGINTLQLKSIALNNGVKESQYNKLMGYLNKYRNQIKNTKYATFVDFAKPSSQERMFVLNLETGALKKYLVAHGKNSGELYATSFSNTPESNKSSLGLYVVQGSYIGKHGTSLFMDGLEGSNNNARERNIVIHSANYVSKSFVKSQGRLGRSLGCPAMNANDFSLVKNQIRDGSLFLMYN